MNKQFELCVGPIHPALKEPIKLDFQVEGERVKGVSFSLGQVHRAIEWAATKRNPIQVLYMAERICGICNMCHPMAFSMAIESAAGIEVPERAEFIRTINAELERIHSHILWAGVAAHELGFDSLMHYTWRVREKVLDIIEYLNGNRITKGVLMIGGVRRDIPEKDFAKVREALNYYKELYAKLESILLKDRSIMARTREIGILTKKDALELCAVGPTARASGVKKDIRVDWPYAAYPELEIEPITPESAGFKATGDTYDRIVVRLLEIKQSIELIEQCLDKMKPGPILAEPVLQKLLVQLKTVQGEGVAFQEAPRGELIHYIKMTGQEAPYAWKVRAPTYANLPPLVPMLSECEIADIPIIVASIDPCMSCTNRAIITDKNNSMLSMEELRELSIKKTLKMQKEALK
ncbi:MAG: nickel-dependent hydrogenase large subunit [Candidatus Diapherotrites archaeon]